MIMHSQTNLCYKRPSSSENIIGTKTNWKFSPTAVTMTLDKQSTLHFSLTWCTIKLSWSQKTKQFWRYSQNIQILIIYAMTLTVTLDLTLKIAASCRTLELIMMPHLQQFWLGKIQPHGQMERWTQRQMDMIKKERKKKRQKNKNKKASRTGDFYESTQPILTWFPNRPGFKLGTSILDDLEAFKSGTNIGLSILQVFDVWYPATPDWCEDLTYAIGKVETRWQFAGEVIEQVVEVVVPGNTALLIANQVLKFCCSKCRANA